MRLLIGLVPLFTLWPTDGLTGLGQSPSPPPASAAFIGASLSISVDGVLNPGVTTDLLAHGAGVGEAVYFVLTNDAIGAGPCPGVLGGACLDLVNPMLLGSSIADASGVATYALTVPNGVALGASLHLQAVVIRGIGGVDSVLSRPVTTVVGGGGTPVLDQFVHFPAAADFLFVVDDSCSMSGEQANLANSFPTMIDTVLDQGLDFHVGVVSTDMADPAKSGLLQPDASSALWIDPSDPNPDVSFLEMASLGTAGSVTEQGLAAVDAALFVHGSGGNLGFRRVTAQLAVIVLTDEEDQSPGLPAPYADDLEDQAFYNGDVSFTAIAGPVGGGTCGAIHGARYTAVTNQVGGITASICDTDYTPALTALVETLWTSVPYTLSSVPDPATIVVTSYEGGVPFVLAASDWVFDAEQNTVRFTSSYTTASGTDLDIEYTEL